MHKKTAVESKRMICSSGFTAIELLVTIAVLGILLALAIPSFVEFAQASRGSTVSSQFVAGMARARSEAISQNACVKICQSANAANGKTATCAGSGDDWQRGWILFRVPSCNSAVDNPVDTDILAVNVGSQTDFELFTPGGAVRHFMFDPRGILVAGGLANMTLSHLPDGTSNKHARTICVSIAGRVTVREWGLGCTS